MRADTGVLEDLAAKVAELERRMDDVVRLHEILIGAGRPVPVPRPPRPRDRHGLYGIDGGGRR
jgi:hypothetical protein